MSRQQNNSQYLINDFVDILGTNFRNVLGNGVNMIQNRPNNYNRISLDIVNDENTITIFAELPGIDKDNINVDFFNNKLTISAKKIRSYNNPDICEIKFGQFERSLTLPICVTKKDTVSVQYTDGILKIKINKLVEEENKFSVKPVNN
jgi:HSP20 family protein